MVVLALTTESLLCLLGKLHRCTFWCHRMLPFSPVLLSLAACRGQNSLCPLHQMQAERDDRKKADCLSLGLHICYYFILIVPSNSRLKSALCVWGSMYKSFLFLSEEFFLSFILQLSSPYPLPNLHLKKKKSLQRNITSLLFLLSYHLLVVEMGSTRNGNYYYFSHYIRILLSHSCWPYDQPFFGETLFGFTV